MKKHLFSYCACLFLTLFVVLFSSIDVFAAEFNMNSYTSATLGGTKNRYRGTEIYNTGMSNTYTFGTQYSGRLSDIETYFDYPFSANTSYRFTYNMNTDDFRNNFGSSYWWDCSNGNENDMTNTNAVVVSPVYVSMKKVQLNINVSENTSCIRVWLRSKNLSSTAITGVSNWRLNNITIYDPDWQNGTTSGNGSQGTTNGSITGTTASNPNGDIINNNNQNTQDIINNNNTNTQIIIDNQNQNTQQQIESQQVCGNYDYSKDNIPLIENKMINSNGVVFDNTNNNLSDYIYVQKDKTYSLDVGTTAMYNPSYCLFDTNKVKLSCVGYSYNRNFSITPTEDGYIRFSMYRNATITTFTGSACKNGNQALNDSIQEQTEVSRSIFGKIGDIFTSIINLPIKIAEKLLDMIKSLFIPDSEEFEELIDDFKDVISEKLGVIYQAGELIINTFSSIINDNSNDNACITFPNISLPNNLTIIQEQEFCFNSITDSFPVLLTLIRSISGVFITITFINMLKNKYDNFINGGKL